MPQARRKGLTDEERAILEGREPKQRRNRKTRRKAPETRSTAIAEQYGPTPEQRRKSPYGYGAEVVIPGAGPVEPVKRHKKRTTVERYRKYLTDVEQDMLRRFVLDAERATSQNITTKYDGIGGGSFGPRHGGVIDINRAAHERHYLIRQNVPIECWEILKDLVLSIRAERLDREFTIHEVAHRHAPHLRSKESLALFGVGLLKATAWVLRDAYQWIDTGTKPNSNAMLQIWRERVAKAG